MKQKKGRDYKSTRQLTDEDRMAKNRLGKNIEAAKTRGELVEDKLVPQQADDNDMNGTKKGVIGVVAFLLCIFFFMLPIVQYTKDSLIALSGWGIASRKYIPVASCIYVNVIDGGTVTTDHQGYITEGTNVKINVIPNQNYQLSSIVVMSATDPINEKNTENGIFFTMPASDVTINGTFELIESEYLSENEIDATISVSDVITNEKLSVESEQFSENNIDEIDTTMHGSDITVSEMSELVEMEQISEYDIDESDTTIREDSKYLYVNILRESKINFIFFILLLIPIAVIVLTFTKVSFGILRNVTLMGVAANIAYIIFVYALYADYFIPTVFSWIILSVIIGLCAFSHYCIISE